MIGFFWSNEERGPNDSSVFCWLRGKSGRESRKREMGRPSLGAKAADRQRAQIEFFATVKGEGIVFVNMRAER